jgi:hypothetical protein
VVENDPNASGALRQCEFARQADVLEAGVSISHESRGWDESS